MLRNFGILVSAVVVLMALTLRASASTELIVDDTFNAPDGSIQGRTPNVADLPGTTWSSAGQGVTIFSDRAEDIGDGAAGIDIASAGAYTKPTLFTISADEDLGPSAAAHPASYGDGASIFGLRLGFFGADPAGGGGVYRGGAGIVYTVSTSDPTQGELLLINSSTSYTDLGITGFSTTGSYNLSYTVDTTTGAITTLTFNGASIAVPSTATFTDTSTSVSTPGVSTALFTNAATNWAGIYQRADSIDITAAFADNFEITTQVPEPASMSLLAVGGMAVMGLRRRRA